LLGNLRFLTHTGRRSAGVHAVAERSASVIDQPTESSTMLGG